MKYVSRSKWDARFGRGGTNVTPGRGGVTVHYEGGGKLTGRPHSQCAAKVRAIESHHVNVNGWVGIAYTLLVCEHGYVFEGRGLGRRTAANGTNSGNQNWYAVCALIGDEDPLSDPLLHGIRDAIDYLRGKGAGSRINGHRDHLPTSCPGSRLYAWVKKGAPRPGGGSNSPSKVDYWDVQSTTAKRRVRVPWATPILRQGSSGSRVEWLQDALKGLGHGLAVDGDFGPATERELKEFQSGHRDENGDRLDDDGVYGHHTARGLFIAHGGKAEDAT